MNKTLLLTVAFAAVMGLQTVSAQDDKPGDYRTMSREQLEAIASKAQSDYEMMKDRANDAKSQMKDAKRTYNEANRNYKDLTKQMNGYKTQLKAAKKALKLRDKLNKLPR